MIALRVNAVPRRLCSYFIIPLLTTTRLCYQGSVVLDELLTSMNVAWKRIVSMAESDISPQGGHFASRQRFPFVYCRVCHSPNWMTLPKRPIRTIVHHEERETIDDVKVEDAHN